MQCVFSLLLARTQEYDLRLSKSCGKSIANREYDLMLESTVLQPRQINCPCEEATKAMSH
jgi:hypothetical protein